MAFPANHREVPANWEKTSIGKIQNGLFFKFISDKIVQDLFKLY